MDVEANNNNNNINKFQHQSSLSSPVKPQIKLWFITQVCLRVLIVATTLIAACMTITNKQSIVIGIFVLEARYFYSSAFKFFVVANLIGAAFSLVSLASLFAIRQYQYSNPAHYFLLFLNDLVITCLVLAGCAAATAIGIVSKYGNNHAGWMPICDHFASYCHRSSAYVALSYLSVILLFAVTVLSAIKSKQSQV